MLFCVLFAHIVQSVAWNRIAASAPILQKSSEKENSPWQLASVAGEMPQKISEYAADT